MALLMPLPPSDSRIASASVKLATGSMRTDDPTARRAAANSSSLCPFGTKNTFAPAAFTATAFCASAPIAPTDLLGIARIIFYTR